MIKKKNINNYIFFSIVLGIVATLWHYSFGIGDQSEQLVFVYKALDNSFLANDSFANLASGFSVRTYFAHFVAFFARFLGVPATCFILTLFSNVMLALFTYLIGYKISGKQASGIFAAILVMTLTTINMGDITTLYSTGISSDRLALPLIFAAFYFAIQYKPTPVAILCGLASIFHILMGAVAGGILLSVMLVHHKLLDEPIKVKQNIKAWLILFGFSLLVIIPFALTNQQHIDTAEFIQTYAYFRNPHHFLPSYIFTSKLLLRSILFIGGSLLAGYLLYKKFRVEKSILIYLLLVFLSIIDLCIFGYLFVEVFPTRIGVLLQPYRFTILFKWIALVLIGTYIGLVFSEKGNLVRGIYIFASVLSPVLLFVTFVYELFCQFNKNEKLKFLTKPIFGVVLVASYLLYKATNPETLVLFIWLALALALIYLSKKWYYLILFAFLLIVGLNSTLLKNHEFKNHKINDWFSSNYRPVFTYEGYNNDVFDICQFVEKNIPLESVFLTPSEMAEFRTVAKRAAVVSFKMVPFTDMAIRDWKNRLDFCYGTTDNLGYEAEREMSLNYRSICDEHLQKVKEKYGITHAVLFQDTNCNYSVLYSNTTYKVVRLAN